MSWADAIKERTLRNTRAWYREGLGERYFNSVVKNIHLRDAVPMLMGLAVVDNGNQSRSYGKIKKLRQKSNGYLDITTDTGYSNYFQEFQLFEDGDMGWIYGSSWLIKMGECGMCKHDCKMREKCPLFEEREV